MEPQRLKSGNLLVPNRAEGDGLTGDGMVEVSPGDPLYEAWDKWIKKDSGATLFAELSRFCQSGENAGKPGPCPTGKKEREINIPTKGGDNRRYLIKPIDDTHSLIIDPYGGRRKMETSKIEKIAAHRQEYERRSQEHERRQEEKEMSRQGKYAKSARKKWGERTIKGIQGAAQYGIHRDHLIDELMEHGRTREIAVSIIEDMENGGLLWSTHMKGNTVYHPPGTEISERHAALHFSDADTALFSDLEQFCQSGPNEGKPGPCPEHQNRKRSVLARAGKAGRAVRVGKVMEHRVLSAIEKHIPEKARRAAGLVVKAAFSSWLPAQTAARAVAHEIAMSAARGTAHEIGGARHAKRVGRLLVAADLAAAKTIAPAIGAVAGPAAGGVAYMLPLASTAYLAYATVRHPRATIAAAQKAIAGVREKIKSLGGKSSKHAEDAKWAKEDIATLLRGFATAGEREDWYDALVHAALDETRGDLPEAAKLADAALSER